MLNEIVDEIHSPINSENATIHVPVREVLSGSENGESVRMASLLFRNMSGLLPERLPEEADRNRSAQNSESNNNIITLARMVNKLCGITMFNLCTIQ